MRTKRRSTIDSMTRGTILLTTDASSVGRAILTELERRPTRSGGRRLAGATTGPTLAVGDQQVPGIEGQLLAIVHVASVCAAPSTAELTMPELHAAFSFGERFGAPIYLVSSGFPCDEQAVAAVRASGLPHVLVRTSLVIGSTRSRTGPNPRALTQLIDAAVSGLLPFTHMDTQLLDLVPSDIVAQTIIALIADGTSENEYWLTSGELAVPARRLLGAAIACASERGIVVDSPTQACVDAVVDSVLGSRERQPLDTSLGDRFQNSLGEVGGLGVPALPDRMDMMATAIDSWERDRTHKMAQ